MARSMFALDAAAVSVGNRLLDGVYMRPEIAPDLSAELRNAVEEASSSAGVVRDALDVVLLYSKSWYMTSDFEALREP